MHAKTREELDTALNEKRLDRIVLSGFDLAGGPPPLAEGDGSENNLEKKPGCQAPKPVFQ